MFRLCRPASRINVADKLGRSSPFSCGGSRLEVMRLGGMEARPHDVSNNRFEKTFKHGRVLLVPVLGVSLPRCKPSLGQTLHNKHLYNEAHTCWEYTSSMGRTLRSEHPDKQPG